MFTHPTDNHPQSHWRQSLVMQGVGVDAVGSNPQAVNSKSKLPRQSVASRGVDTPLYHDMSRSESCSDLEYSLRSVIQGLLAEYSFEFSSVTASL